MTQINGKSVAPAAKMPFILNLMPLAVLAILVLAKVISAWNASILAVIWLVLIQGNTEVFLVAFILAMIIRCFCIEVYKIPTGSMEPTLHGDYRDGDKIIANKFGILFSPIKRYDVFLFKYPLDKSTSFIKRVVGLPDEEIMINGGDIYARHKGADKFLIAKKPLKIQESIWIPLIETDQTMQGRRERYNPSLPIKEWELPDNQINLQGESVTLQDGEIMAYKTIKDRYINNHNSGINMVSDIKLSFKIRAETPGGEIYSTIKTRSGDFTLRLFPKPSEPYEAETPNLNRHFRTPTFSQSNNLEYRLNGSLKKNLPVEAIIKADTEHLIEILNFDGTIYVKINGQQAIKYDYIKYIDDIASAENIRSPYQIELGARKQTASISEPKIWRDIYYDSAGILKNRQPLTIPQNKYFSIGDNIPNSKDSRLWEIRAITLQDGSIIQCDAKPNETYKEDFNTIAILRNKRNNRGGDVWGASHLIHKDTILSDTEEPAPFIDKTEIFGRALFVYWPLNRIKLIR